MTTGARAMTTANYTSSAANSPARGAAHPTRGKLHLFPFIQMKTMISKYAGRCATCAETIAQGDVIAWSRATGAKHPKCAGIYIPESPQDVRGPCWICGAPDGKFRQHGAATSVHCDACHAAPAPAAIMPPRSRYRSNYVRFSSGAEIIRNKGGRCIDAPCCGCCS